MLIHSLDLKTDKAVCSVDGKRERVLMAKEKVCDNALKIILQFSILFHCCFTLKISFIVVIEVAIVMLLIMAGDTAGT